MELNNDELTVTVDLTQAAAYNKEHFKTDGTKNNPYLYLVTQREFTLMKQYLDDNNMFCDDTGWWKVFVYNVMRGI